MKKRFLYTIWAVLYALCAGLGHIIEASGIQAGALTLFSFLFFVPPTILLVDARRAGDKKTIKLLRWICIGSLSATTAVFIANVATALAPETVGNVLYEILIFVSVPMVCSQVWILSLFLWACLLFATLPGKNRVKIRLY